VIETVGILIAAGDRQHACPQDIGDAMGYQRRVASVGDQTRQSLGNSDAPFGSGKQHHATVRGDASTVECSGQLLAPNGWKTEQLGRIIGHGGCGSA